MSDTKPLTMPLPEGFFIRRIDPLRMGYKTALQMSELLLHTFQTDKSFAYWMGRKNQMHGETWKDICDEHSDTQARLDAYRDRAISLNNTIHSFARNFHLDLLEGNEFAGGLYEKKVVGGKPFDRLVGVYIWIYPSFMTPRQTLYQRLVWSWFKVKYTIERWWMVLRYGHNPVTHNTLTPQFIEKIASLDPVPTTPEETDRLAQLSYNELIDEPYPSKDMVLLAWFYIAQDLHGKGFGSNLFEYALDEVPKVKTPFTSSDGKSQTEGPQKQYLIASPGGRYLYRKFGFDEGLKFEFVPKETAGIPEDYECIRWRQLKTVEV